jgi:hypothetical protein
MTEPGPPPCRAAIELTLMIAPPLPCLAHLQRRFAHEAARATRASEVSPAANPRPA